jgi:DNA-binding Xre family transcriptional regulator
MPIKVTLDNAIKKRETALCRTITYEELAKKTGLAKSTIESIASRTNYNTTILTLSLIQDALDCELSDLIQSLPKLNSKKFI